MCLSIGEFKLINYEFALSGYKETIELKVAVVRCNLASLPPLSKKEKKGQRG